MLSIKKLKQAREKAKLTQLEVANMAGISLLSYQRYEAEMRKPNIVIAFRLADVLKTDVSKLFGDYRGTSENKHLEV